MATLHIALEDGFTGQSVAIATNGREVFNQAGVKTDLRIARAAAFDVAAEAALVRVDVRVEPGGLHGSTDVDTRSTPYLCIDINAAGAIAFRHSAEMPRYM